MIISNDNILGYVDIMVCIDQTQQDIKMFQGLIYELKKLRRPCILHIEELNRLKRQKEELRSSLLN